MIDDRNAAELFNTLYCVLIGCDAVVAVVNKPAVDVCIDRNGVVFNAERYAQNFLFSVHSEVFVAALRRAAGIAHPVRERSALTQKFNFTLAPFCNFEQCAYIS